MPQTIARPATRPGVVTVIAGDAAAGGAWREGTFDRAKFYGISDLKFDAQGNLVGCEHWFGNRVRVVANRTATYFGQAVRAGQVATIVGNGYGWNLPRAQRYTGNNLPVLQAQLSRPRSCEIRTASRWIRRAIANPSR